MIKNKIPHLMLQTAYAALGLVVIGASFGLYDLYEPFPDMFFVQFTNVSNYFCIVVMALELIYTVRSAAKGENGSMNVFRKLKFMGVVWMIITVVVYFATIAGADNRYEIIFKGEKLICDLPIRDFRIGSILAHIVLPTLYIIDWVLFYERGKEKWYYPLISLIGPVIYILTVYARTGVLVLTNSSLQLYPYGFLAINSTLPLVLLAFFVAFTGFGFLVFGTDKLLNFIHIKYRASKQNKIKQA